jgi:alpha-glucosidase
MTPNHSQFSFCNFHFAIRELPRWIKPLAFSSLCLFILAAPARSQESDTSRSIGPVIQWSKTSNGVSFICGDRSNVQVSILAPDLVRVRAAFGKLIPPRDHSWAIDKTSWEVPRWDIKEEPYRFLITTDELEVIVDRAPFLIEFRDAKSHRFINADAHPMTYDPKEGTIGATKRLGLEEHFYGLGEKAARLDKRRSAFSMWNSDTPAYGPGTDPLYQSVPFYMGLQNGEAYGIFFDNSYRTHFDFGRSSNELISFSAEGGEMNYYFFWGPSMRKILGRYADLTGRMPMPPMWALGNQQSRWSYYPDTMAEAIVNRYRAEDLPLDVLYLDIDYMNGYRVFTWDRQRYPDPKAFTDRLKRQGVKVVTIVDPGVKHQPSEAGATDESHQPELAPQEKSYYVYNQGVAKDYFLKRGDGEQFVGKVWPGKAVFADYTLEGARKWWGDLHRAYFDQGVMGIWNDMNEPSDFVDQTGKAQMDVVSFDEGERSTHAKNRNVFALLMARATYEGLERLRPGVRPYVITRAGYAGIQRYSTMWTGDNTSTWDSLAISIPMFETLGLSGEPFVGADVGGFMSRGDGELLARWYEVGFLTPMCRNHKEHEYDQEPWRFGKYYEDIIRKYLKLRYRMIPFLYTLLEESHRTGLPLFRPLLLNYQSDYNTLNVDDEFMLGTDLLVAPILRPGLTKRLVYLPEGTWIDYWTGKSLRGGTVEVEAPLDTVPMFVRGGAIIPMGPEMTYVGEKPTDPITFNIYPDDAGRAATSLYEDDGLSTDYKQGVFRRTEIQVSKLGKGFQIDLVAPSGSYRPSPRNLVFVIKSVQKPSRVLLDGNRLTVVDASGKTSGWYKTADGVAVRIADDNTTHRVQIQ